MLAPMNAAVAILKAAPRRTRWILEVGWALILVKCAATPWIIAHWQIPVHPGWIIGPTLGFAVLVTIVIGMRPRVAPAE